MSGSRTPPHGEGSQVPLLGILKSRSKAPTKRDSIPNFRPASPIISEEQFDEYGGELDPEARVWDTYVKVADKNDAELVDEWTRILDVTLVYAALFTAFSTAFVIESSKTLREGAAEKSDRRLDHMTKILLVLANITDRSELDPAQILAPRPTSPRNVDVCINALWFFSLTLSASVALIAMLAREWCTDFSSSRTGDPWSRAKRRQQLWDGIEEWRMEQVILFLPSAFHLAFFSFMTGLCIYLGDLHWGAAGPTIVLGATVTSAYFALTALPLLNETCPYRTTVTRIIILLAQMRDFQKDKSSKNIDDCDEKTLDRIAIRALAWLIKANEDQTSTDIALQAIAGAYSDGENSESRKLLKSCEADTMICRRLIDLDSYSGAYQQILDLYSRAQYFFQPTPATTETKPGAPNTVPEKDASNSSGVRKDSGWVPQKDLNKQLQIKLRNLRKIMNREITTYVTSPNSKYPFLPTPENIQALRIGSTAASHCLRSLQQQGLQLQTQELFDSVITLLESYRNRQARLNDKEIDYLMTGAAILLSSLLVGCPSDMVAHNVMSLLRMADRVANTKEQQSLKLEHLRFPLLAFALSRYNYPGWIRPPPLNEVSRAERAIDVIAYYVENPAKLTDEVTSTMSNLGLLELLSKPMDYGLTGDELKTISEAFVLRARGTSPVAIHTFTAAFQSDVYSRTLRSIDQMLEAGPSELDSTVAATAYLTVLNQTRATQGDSGTLPSGRTYAFITGSIYKSTLPQVPGTPENYNRNTALDLMQHFLKKNYLHRISRLAQSFGEGELLVWLKNISEDASEVDDDNVVMRMFATGQVWLLMCVPLESGTADDKDWRECLGPFLGGESRSASLEVVNRKLEAEKKILADRYTVLYNMDAPPRHPYFHVIYAAVSRERNSEGSPSSSNT